MNIYERVKNLETLLDGAKDLLDECRMALEKEDDARAAGYIKHEKIINECLICCGKIAEFYTFVDDE